MSIMDRLAATLDDVDELLDEADAQTITESLERGEAPDHVATLDRCEWCGHDFHGLPCHPPIDFLVSMQEAIDDGIIDDAALPLEHPGAAWWPCRCASALERRDDTWRPIRSGDEEAKLSFDVDWHMHRTGLDGWAARADLLHGRGAYERLVRQLTEGMADAGRHLAEMARALAGAGRHIHLHIPRNMPCELVPVVLFHPGGTDVELVDEQVDEVPIETLAARALRLRRERNTGPARPTAERARRPRSHR